MIQKDCKIYISEIDWQGVERTFNNDFWESFYTPLLQEGFRQQEIALLEATAEPMILNRKIWEEQCVRLQDGDVLRCGSHTLECILTPGHTPGHLCLYEPERKWFFSGDHVLFTITPNISRWDAFPDIISIYMDSLKKVRDLQAERLLPAHRGVRKNLEQRVNELLEHHSKRFEEIRRILQKAGGQTAYEVAGQMSWKIRSKNWEEFPLEQKYFAVEEALAHLDYLEAHSFVRCQEQDGRKVYFVV